jgi:hypothetical protein
MFFVIARNTQYDEAIQNYENKKLSILLVAFFLFLCDAFNTIKKYIAAKNRFNITFIAML